MSFETFTGNVPAGLHPMHPDVIQVPERFYEAARRERQLVYKVPDADLYIILGYALIKEALEHPEIFSNDIRRFFVGADLDALLMPAPALIIADPPVHRQTRELVRKAFVPTRVAGMETYIQTIVDELIDAFIDRGEAELYSAFAMPLPIAVIADQLGVPRSDMKKFREWSDAIVLAFNLAASEEQRRTVPALLSEMNAYMLEKLREKRARPESDIISTLGAAELDAEDPTGGSDGGRRPLTDDEFLSIVQQLLLGGNENTTAALMSAVLYLIRHPDVMDSVRRRPEKLGIFIEELVRLETPCQGFVRVTTRDIVFGGVALPANTLVMLRYGSGNLDDQQFAEPAVVNLDRANITAHLGFGGGAHHCVGAMLARKEMLCALRTLLARLGNIRLSPGKPPPAYAPIFHSRALTSLHISFNRS